MIIKHCRKCSLPSVATCFDINGGFLQHKTRLPSAQFTALLLLHSWHTTWASWLSHTGADLIFVSGKNSFGRAHGLLTIAVAARYRCVKRRTMHTAINHAHCCSARLFAQRATQPGGRPPTVLAKQTSTIIFSSTSSSLLQTTPTVYCATPVSVIFQAKKQDTTHVIYKFINN